MKYITDQQVLVQDISGSTVTGDGTTAQEFMYMTMDIGQGQDQDDHMNQAIGIADLVVNPGSEVDGTERMHHAVHVIVIITEGKCATLKRNPAKMVVTPLKKA